MAPHIRYIARRLVYAVLTVLTLTTITFLLMHLLPGNPFSGNRVLQPAVEEALMVKYGLDKPPLVQYGIYLGNVLRGDLGTSLLTGRPVTDTIAMAFPVSLELGVRALIFALLLGLGLGVVAALKRGTAWDSLVMLVALIGVSVPSFIVGALLQYFLGLMLYRATGIHFFDIMGWDGERSKLLPSFALAFSTVAIIGRLMRASMLEVLGQDYIRTARAKGLTLWEIVRCHCLRNAILPVVTVLGPLTAVLFTGAFAVENVFSIPGLGQYFVSSVRSNDYPVIVGTTLFFGGMLVLCNLAADILRSFLDPRVRLTGGDGP